MSIRITSIAFALFLSLLPAAAPAADAPAGDVLDAASAKADEKGQTLFYDIRALGLEGQGWSDIKNPFDRLPAKAEGVVRPAVWNLSHQSAGLCVRFVTDAPTIAARWSLTSPNLAMPHMAATGVSGVDLYVRTGADGHWHWLAIGKPTAQKMTATLVSGLPAGKREYLLYLPLYNGVTSVEVGVPRGVALAKAPPRPADKTKPIIFYGTSITQGGCASRPGTCHPAIVGRRFDRPVINLGFSGNGIMEPEVAALLAELDPAVFVIDCLPNMDAKGVSERAENLVKTIRAKHAETPILLVEDRTMSDAFLVEAKQKGHDVRRAALKKAYDNLIAGGDKHLTYLPGEHLLGADGDDTVDSSHPTDLGFFRQADAFEAALKPLLAGK